VQGRRVGKVALTLVFLITPLGLFLYLAAQRRWRSVLKLLGFGPLMAALNLPRRWGPG
jgi:hypothetical protein